MMTFTAVTSGSSVQVAPFNELLPPVLASVTHDGDAWLFDDAPDAEFVHPPEIALPYELIPPPPDFILQQP
jgi:putative SOS response-associated peptidase YedK